MLTIRIKQYSFELSDPFAEGTVLTRAEAQALNALRAENIRNNMARAVEKETAKLLDGQLLSPEALAALQETISTYDRNYQFPSRHQPRPRKGELDLVTEEVARERVEAQARQDGTALNEATLVARTVEFCLLPAVQEEARRRLAERQSVAMGSLEDLL